MLPDEALLDEAPQVDELVESAMKELGPETAKRVEIIKESGAFPVCTHFTPTSNFLQMLEGVNDPKFGWDSLRLRIDDINKQLGIETTKGWGSDRGRVSFYFSAGKKIERIDNTLYGKEDEYVLVDNESESAKAVSADPEGKTVAFVLPWTSLLLEDGEGFSKADASELQIDLNSVGSPEELVKRGVSLMHPAVVILASDKLKPQIEKVLDSITDPVLVSQLRHKIKFLNQEECNSTKEQIQSGRFFRTIVDQTSEITGKDSEEIYEFFAFASRLSPREFTPSRLLREKDAFFEERLNRDGIQWAVEYVLCQWSPPEITKLYRDALQAIAQEDGDIFPAITKVVEKIVQFLIDKRES